MIIKTGKRIEFKPWHNLFYEESLVPTDGNYERTARMTSDLYCHIADKIDGLLRGTRMSHKFWFQGDLLIPNDISDLQ